MFSPRLSLSVLGRARPIACLAVLITVLPVWAAGTDVGNDDLATCLSGLRSEAVSKGIGRDDFDRLTQGLGADWTVIDALNFQPEFHTPVWDYLAGLVDEQRIADGRQQLVEQRGVLTAIAGHYGIDPETLAALWGVESDYGRVAGQRPLLRSLATLSCHGRRQPYFRDELYAALRIVADGNMAADDFRGSWAGAFGHTQFMPSTFLRIAVDFDGDGRRDLIGSIPDALASTANYLADAGWRRGLRWGVEVRLPPGFDVSLAGRRNNRLVTEWQTRGIAGIAGTALSGIGQNAALLLPAGAGGPAFLIGRNFQALYRYNASESYALAIALLSDRLRGGPGLATGWPTDDPGLSRIERRELQSLLIARGHDIGEIDGMIGTRSRAAIMAEQNRLGLPEEGRAGRRILERLRSMSLETRESAPIGEL